VALGVVLDSVTKRLALATLEPGVTRRALGGLLQLTLGFNPGIAFGLHLGGASRLVFTLLALGVLAAVIALYHATAASKTGRLCAIALMCAGAAGNLADRVRNPHGVVDFLGPYDLGFMRWPIFNLADCWVVIGTLGLALSLWLERRRHPDWQAYVAATHSGDGATFPSATNLGTASRPLRVAVAGPYSAPTEAARQHNLDLLHAAAAAVAARGHVPVIGVEAALPQVGALPESERYEAIMRISLDLVDGCDALLLLAESPGANRERDLVLGKGLPVYRQIDELPVAEH
jgi:signal peptidase II